MNSGELLIKEKGTLHVFKVKDNAEALEDFFIFQKKAFLYEANTLLNHFLLFFESNFNDDMTSYYPNGFSIGLTNEKFKVKKMEDIAQLLFMAETRLFNKIRNKNLETSKEEYLNDLGETVCLLIDLDEKKIFGYLDSDAEFIVLNEHFEQIIA